jgi:hypothetical protein
MSTIKKFLVWIKKHLHMCKAAEPTGTSAVDPFLIPWTPPASKPYQPKDACWIVNHSPSFSPSGGSHWVACRVKGTTAFWFDSYSLPPHAQLENALMGSKSDPHPYFDRWLERMGVETVVYNDRDLQSVASEVCGLYACYFAAHGLPQLAPTGHRVHPYRQLLARHF